MCANSKLNFLHTLKPPSSNSAIHSFFDRLNERNLKKVLLARASTQQQNSFLFSPVSVVCDSPQIRCSDEGELRGVAGVGVDFVRE